ncbi:hypothetical protein BCR37DRAFT_222436 [Protomyces lactucae-debilis]|uniref:ER membrane protein complex subunit 7 beta-sandwich domain-containing protein n=1 Tax=Protomyces lactucae-debilis TaxID=2754530 RepID=A0A1Y2EU43_PROLT|nr:uncharacterized protein BCR37DRAFT_222436 [Protomyces lactucae-debilis]ORY74365.1 hypothetical protein BCR37DRAFT_222436 [Protomyces lactucae-debilis]
MLFLLLLSVCAAAHLNGTAYSRAATAQQPAVQGGFQAFETLRLSSAEQTYTAKVSADGSFAFTEIVPGSYSLYGPSLNREHYRVDVGEEVKVWLQKVGTPWSAVGALQALPLQVMPKGTVDFYTPRPSLNPLKMLKSPLVWIGIVMVFSLFGLPKLTAWMDPDGIAEMESMREKTREQQGEQVVNPVERLQNMDLSGWLAGRT